MTHNQPSLFPTRGTNAYGAPLAPEQLRDAALSSVADNAGPEFMRRAKAFVLDYLAQRGARSAEDLTDACIAAGIKPHNDKAFGAVLAQLSRRKLIVAVGTCKRRKGRNSGACFIWELAKGR